MCVESVTVVEANFIFHTTSEKLTLQKYELSRWKRQLIQMCEIIT
jgi:hypothetical protein